MGEPRTKTRVGEANVEKILDAALTTFARFGLHGARTDQIAEAAGMSKPNLLYYFHSKEELYLAVLKRTLGVWLEALAEIDPDAEPRQALTDYITAKLEFSRAYPDQSRLFATEIIQGAPWLKEAILRDLAPIVEAKVATLTAWIADGRLAPVDPTTLILTIWATTQNFADFSAQTSLLTGRTLDDPGYFDQTRDAIIAIVLAGVLPRS
ncbi:MAG: TetR family transcriptional regulator C-terminal domain-containing protein [Ancalomicrobiaceae bacterium]|nr:TetR family transcriptional regulator C-terminal domain-containing protein [Ancalomicrobiaceae bacterium]